MIVLVAAFCAELFVRQEEKCLTGLVLLGLCPFSREFFIDHHPKAACAAS